MKPMIWHPEDQDHKVSEYLDRVNHAPYQLILALLIALVCVVTLMILVGSF
jgi:hypothetical protein